MTPEWCARDMVEYFQPTGRILEPFRGEGVFCQILPSAAWCEIDEGRDFYEWVTPVDWIISNPPYSITRAVFAHARRLATNVVFLVPLRNIFSGYGFVRELRSQGGLPAIRLYGTGGRLGFPMGNCIGAIHWQLGYTGPTLLSDYHDSAKEIGAKGQQDELQDVPT